MSLNYLVDSETATGNELWCTAFASSNIALAGGLDGKLRIWDTSVSRTEAQATIPSPTSSLAIVSLAAHNDYVITNSLDSKLCRYGLPDGAHQASTSLKPSQAWQIALHPEGNVLATAGDIAKVSLLKASQEGFGEVLSTMDGRGVFATCCAYSPNGTLLATATSSGEVSLYDAAQGVLIQTFPAHAKTIRSLTFSADSALLITGGDDAHIKVFDVRLALSRRSMSSVTSMEAHSGWLLSLGARGDGKVLASGSADGTIKLWDFAHLSAPLTTIRDQPKDVWSISWRPQAPSTALEGVAGTGLGGGAFVSAGSDGNMRFYRATGAAA